MRSRSSGDGPGSDQLLTAMCNSFLFGAPQKPNRRMCWPRREQLFRVSHGASSESLDSAVSNCSTGIAYLDKWPVRLFGGTRGLFVGLPSYRLDGGPTPGSAARVLGIALSSVRALGSGMSVAAAQAARERAERAKVREIAAHRRAIILQENAAALFDSLGLSARSDIARERAERARAMLELAFVEQAQAASSALSID